MHVWTQCMFCSACPLWGRRQSMAQCWNYFCPAVETSLYVPFASGMLKSSCSVTISDWIVVTRVRGVAGVRTQFSEFSPYFVAVKTLHRSQWPLGLRHRSAAAPRLRLWVRIPPGGMDVCLLWVLCVLSGRGLCDKLITRPEKYYRLWCVVVCDIGASWMRKTWPNGEAVGPNKKRGAVGMAGSPICTSQPV